MDLQNLSKGVRGKWGRHFGAGKKVAELKVWEKEGIRGLMEVFEILAGFQGGECKKGKYIAKAVRLPSHILRGHPYSGTGGRAAVGNLQ